MSVIEYEGAITGRLVRARRVTRITRPLKPVEPQQMPHRPATAGATAGARGADTGALPSTLTGVRAANRLVVAALGLGGSVDLLFYGKATGISMLVFVSLVLAALFWAAQSEGVRPAWRNSWLMAPLLFFAAMVAVRASGTLTLLNITATLTLLSMFVYFFAGGRVEQLGLLGYPLTVARAVKGMFACPTPLASAMKRSAAANHDLNRRAFEVARGVLLAIPLLVLFTFLLSSADAVFQGYVGDVLQLHFISNAPEIVLRVVIILSASWLAAGAMLLAAGKRKGAAAGGAATSRFLVMGRGLGFVEAAMVLGLVNALFAVFAWIQFAVLFSGEAARTMNFEDYREYVRRGFGELLVVALLTMILIVGLRRAMRRATEGQERKLKALNSIMIALALVMLVSAFERMVVWENIQFYINTATRIFVRTFIVWLGLLFVWLFFTTWLRRDRFAIGAFLAALGFLATINFINPDADVAAHNVKRNDDLSTRYLYLLSDDAVPALAAGLDTVTGDAIGEPRWLLSSYLSARYTELKADQTWKEWPAFNFSRQQAYDILTKLHDQGKLLP